MRRELLFLLTLNLIFLASCVSNSSTEKTDLADDPIVKDSLIVKNTLDLAGQFRSLRDGLYQYKIEQVKEFFNFPIKSSNNEEWMYISMKENKEYDFSLKERKPLSETDFEKHLSALFPKAFIHCLLKVKSDDLFRMGKFDTEEILEDDGSLHILHTMFDQKNGELWLNHYSESIPDPEDPDQGPLEFSANYLFRVDKQGLLKFVEIRLAG